MGRPYVVIPGRRQGAVNAYKSKTQNPNAENASAIVVILLMVLLLFLLLPNPHLPV
jgi:hypothetical protein